jgi:hypothetical protein
MSANVATEREDCCEVHVDNLRDVNDPKSMGSYRTVQSQVQNHSAQFVPYWLASIQAVKWLTYLVPILIGKTLAWMPTLDASAIEENAYFGACP